MVKCGYRGCTRKFRNAQGVRMHKMRVHDKKGGTKKPEQKQKRKYTGRKKSKPNTVTMTAISYCCFCGNELPNAVVK